MDASGEPDEDEHGDAPPESLGPVDDDPPPWPIHQRLIGAAVKAAFATVGALPLALYILSKEHRWRWAWLWGVLVAGLCAMVILAWERRGSKWWTTALRLAAAGACVTVLAPLAIVWLENLGDPAKAYRALVRMLRFDRVLGLILGTLAVAVFFPLIGVWIYVRNRTAALVPQVCAGLLTMAVPALVAFGQRPSRNVGWAFFFLATGALVPLAVWFADRYAKRWDPKAPTPSGGDLCTVWAVAGVLTWLGFSVPFAPLLFPRRNSFDRQGDSRAQRAMRTLSTAQLLFSKGDKDADGIPDFAGSTLELGAEGLIDAELSGGVHGGYVFRVIRSSDDETKWAATADPCLPHLWRHFVTNHEGKVYSTNRPVPLDPKTCELPKGLSPVR